MFEFFICYTEDEAKAKAQEFGWENPNIQYYESFDSWIVSRTIEGRCE